MVTICTYNARTLASESSIEDLLMQVRRISYDIIGLTETKRRHPFNAGCGIGEELFLGTCDSRGVGSVGILVTSLSTNIDSIEQLTTRIGRLRLKRCGSISALAIFVVYAPTSNYDEEKVEAFYMDMEKFYREDHSFLIRDFNAKSGPRRTSEERHIGTYGLERNEQGERPPEFITATKTIHGNSQAPARFYFSQKGENAAKFKNRSLRTTANWDLANSLVGYWKDAIADNTDEEYDRLIQHLLDSAVKTQSSKVTKRRLSPETLELIRQRGIVRAASNR
ncbi:unnamed protein product [Angiostrongylus costaricensis]|uniref:Endo/exonuclease/phosphatase domain-containing protein n=1 Tax=Angiostrongylus costaricensis TaxID=334426 RepID=A0A0R3PSM3_ANGCS|nr:unnamed protein product [Angiostrongylus costaricensis]